MKVQIMDIRDDDAYARSGYRDGLIGRTGELTIPLSTDEDEWTGGMFILDSPIEMEGELTTELLFWKVKVRPIEGVKPAVKDTEDKSMVELLFDTLWYKDKRVVVAFTCTVDEIIGNPGRYMTICTVMINNCRTGEIVTHTGVAICNPKDIFNYAKGRRLATGRAISAYPYKEQRKLLWSWYWEAVKDANEEYDE